MADADTWIPAVAELVERLGGHPARALGIDLEAPESQGAQAARAAQATGEDSTGPAERWLVACCLLSGRAEEARALAAYRALAEAGLVEPAALAAAEPTALARRLGDARYPDPERAAGRLVRVARGVVECGGSLERLAREAGDGWDLAGRIAALAPGLGPATVTRFLRPLRDAWPAAGEVPLTPAARAAAVHLGILREGEDEGGEPGALRAALRRCENAPPLADVEAALEKLGRRACLRGRTRQCPLADSCPARGRAPDLP